MLGKDESNIDVFVIYSTIWGKTLKAQVFIWILYLKKKPKTRLRFFLELTIWSIKLSFKTILHVEPEPDVVIIMGEEKV